MSACVNAIGSQDSLHGSRNVQTWNGERKEKTYRDGLELEILV